MTTNPIQAVEQEVLTEAVTLDEQIAQADPPAVPPTEEQVNKLAGEIWLANGGIPNDPQTLNHWLDAQTLLISGAPQP